MLAFEEDKSPIFIHSLFRSGSTWLFNCFRHADYWCYQEPFHEALRDLKDHPDALLRFDNRTAKELRHPELDEPYYREIYDIREKIAHKLAKCISYDSFFDVTCCKAFYEYTAGLIDSAPKRPVLQCCRSFGRVRYLKETFGGIHIYLRRNPWDQWWSCQVNDYFDVAFVAVVNGFNPPRVIADLRRDLGLAINKCASVIDEFDLIKNIPLDASERYMLFYALWLYGILENRLLVDIDINIDMLSANEDYRSMIKGRLETMGVSGLDLSSCNVPRAVYTESDEMFFKTAERRVQQMFLASGYSIESLYEAITLQKTAKHSKSSSSDAVRDSSRARDVAIRFANRYSESVNKCQQQQTEIAELRRRLDDVHAEIDLINARADHEKRKLQEERLAMEEREAELLAQMARTRAQAEGEKRILEQERLAMEEREAELLRRLSDSETYSRLKEDEARAAVGRAEESVAEIQHWRRVAERLDGDIKAILRSSSWRVTMPLRSFKGLAVRLGRFGAGLLRRVVVMGKKAAKAIFVRLLRFVLARPALKVRLHPWARRYPSLEARIRRMAVERGLVGGSQVTAHLASVGGPGQLPEPARLIHARLHVLVKSKERGE
ncbi:MAG: hypothetical protein M0031_07905 [Thermaerobacter sp.]|nr:hypothetical protein [Thermaerobacter sp.]